MDVSAVRDGWSLADDPDEVHALLLASDRHWAAGSGLPPPRRDRQATEVAVREGRVHVVREATETVAMFTLAWQPPYPLTPTGFPDRRRPAYLRRLAVRPDRLAAGSLVGVQCVKRAIEVATAAGGDALRSEANPDLVAVLRLLLALGFVRYGEPPADGPLRRIYLQRELGGAGRS
ncbi:hypothetical protein GCM10022225_07600 [Plantactinospora mayteni]|uniref:GNAT family N-acetyltransferase n=1 Tax=Plantactinospora mayteni TaxID=566021 RepID=A0ABQ4EID2_9ACTN|nr:hypothetical protein [Plantactinospora mayteni]GIG94494.1 hypothetical protein Pma05_10670 [Plantactinospora mayteni]